MRRWPSSPEVAFVVAVAVASPRWPLFVQAIPAALVFTERRRAAARVLVDSWRHALPLTRGRDLPRDADLVPLGDR